jgi:hypothetical protein
VLFATGVSLRPSTQFPGLDLYVTDMSAGVTRRAGTVELTRDTANGTAQTAAAIDGVAMSADGRFAAVTTRRTRFVLPTLRLISPERPVADRRELYLLDLQDRTLERVIRTLGGADADGDAGPEVSISGDGGRLAFTSASPSLFRGDANDKIDAFVATRTSEPPAVSPPPPPAEELRSTNRSPPRRPRTLRAV